MGCSSLELDQILGNPVILSQSHISMSLLDEERERESDALDLPVLLPISISVRLHRYNQEVYDSSSRHFQFTAGQANNSIEYCRVSAYGICEKSRS